jgi:glycosyltransferase involved in cell wall biosynthesis
VSATPELSIVTPSFEMLPYLKRAVRSVADQAGVRVEHLVMDGGSCDGSAEWLEDQPGVVAESEKDRGMYDALNKGFRRARGEIVGYLNCDEQYLPGALARVRDFFREHPEIDLVFGDVVLVRPDGSPIAVQKGYPLRWHYVLTAHLYAYSCTLFLRARALREAGFFDVRYRDLGDADLVVRLLRQGRRAAHLPAYLGAFTMTGRNRSRGENARLERERALARAPGWVRRWSPVLNVARRLEKLRAGAYREPGPLAYAIYDSEEALERRAFEVSRPSCTWRSA